MKVCTVCKEKKAEAQFFFKNVRLGKLHAQCKACYRSKRDAYQRMHYQRYGDLYRARAKARTHRIKTRLRALLLAYLSDKQCSHCGISDPRVLDFDHLDPGTKSFSIAKGLADGMTWENILAEIEKCQILCANCHRIRTAEQFSWYRKGATLRARS